MNRLKIQIFTVCASFAFLVPAAAATPASETLEAWQRYTTTVEARLGRERAAARTATHDLTADGKSVPVPSGTISDWHGSVFIRGITLDRLLNGLTNPGTPPPQADVVSSRVLARSDRAVRVYIRLVRHAIVTATYDT